MLAVLLGCMQYNIIGSVQFHNIDMYLVNSNEQ